MQNTFYILMSLIASYKKIDFMDSNNMDPMKYSQVDLFGLNPCNVDCFYLL